MPSRRSVLVAAILVAANLRTPIASLPPLIPRIQQDLHLDSAVAGSLTTLPVLAMGLFAPLASRLAARLGREAAVTVAVIVICAGFLLRLVASTPTLLLATLVGGVGIAAAGTLMPGLVKEFFPDRVGAVTGLTMASMMLGASVSAAFAVPLADRLGGWSASAASWSVVAVLALALWVPVQRRVNERPPDSPRPPLPWRSRTAWLAATYLSSNSVLFYSMLTWLAPSYEDRGWSATGAGVLLSVFGVAQLLAGLVVPAVSDRLHDHRPLFAAAMAATPIGLVAVITGFAPVAAVLVVGFGLGAGFTMGLVLLADYAPTSEASARLSGMAFLVSYSIASLGPLAVGALHDATGGFRAPFTALLVLATAALSLVPRLRPGRLVTEADAEGLSVRGTPAGPGA